MSLLPLASLFKFLLLFGTLGSNTWSHLLHSFPWVAPVIFILEDSPEYSCSVFVCQTCAEEEMRAEMRHQHLKGMLWHRQAASSSGCGW